MLVALVLGFLVSNVRPHHRLVETDGGDVIAAGPEVLAGEIAASPTVFSCDLDGAFALEVAHDVGNGVLRRDAEAHVDVIWHEMPLDDLRFLVPGEFVQDFAEMPSKRAENALLPPFRDKNHMIFAVPSGMAQALVLFHV